MTFPDTEKATKSEILAQNPNVTLLLLGGYTAESTISLYWDRSTNSTKYYIS